MADSHDNVRLVKNAVRLFKDAGCSLVIHAGDFVAPFAARELESLGCPVKAVFGNCDGEKTGLEKTLSSFGEIRNAPLTFRHDDLHFLVTHVLSPLKLYLGSEKYDIVVFGHTHKPEVSQKRKVLLINPGETGGWLSGRSTVALLDTKTRSAEIITL